VYPPQRLHVEGVFLTSTTQVDKEETGVIEKTLKKHCQGRRTGKIRREK